jgi:hypothetical protein
MKRIIRSNALETSVTTVNANQLSESLQTMVNQPPSSIAYLLLLSSILFLAMALTWVWSAKIEEVSQIPGKLVPIDSEKVQQAVAMQTSLDIAETELKQNDSQFVRKFDVQNQHLTKMQTKLSQINPLMVNSYLPDSKNTRKPIKQTKSALRFTTAEADNTLNTANLFFNISNISHNLFPKASKNGLIQLELQQEIQQLRKEILQLQIKLTKTHNKISKIQTQLQQSLRKNPVKVFPKINKPKSVITRRNEVAIASTSGIFFTGNTLNKHRQNSTKNQTIVLATNDVDSGGKVQILLKAKFQKNQELIFDKMTSIIKDREINSNCNLNFNRKNLPQIASEEKQVTKCKMIIKSETNLPVKAKLVGKYPIADILFDPN